MFDYLGWFPVYLHVCLPIHIHIHIHTTRAYTCTYLHTYTHAFTPIPYLPNGSGTLAIGVG